MGQQSGAGGAGKQALVNTLRQFIAEALETFEDNPRCDGPEELEAWHNQCMAMNVAQENRYKDRGQICGDLERSRALKSRAQERSDPRSAWILRIAHQLPADGRPFG